MSIRFTHDTAVTVSWPSTAPDERESDEVDVRLHLTGSPGTHESGRFGPPEHYDPGSPPEVNLERFEIDDGKGGWRKPVGACYPDSNDQGVIDAINSWVEGNEDELIQAMAEYVQDG